MVDTHPASQQPKECESCKTKDQVIAHLLKIIGDQAMALSNAHPYKPIGSPHPPNLPPTIFPNTTGPYFTRNANEVARETVAATPLTAAVASVTASLEDHKLLVRRNHGKPT